MVKYSTDEHEFTTISCMTMLISAQ